MSDTISLRTARPDDLDIVMQLEGFGFPAAICESRDVMQERMHCFADGFLILEKNGNTIGYLCSELWQQEWTDAQALTSVIALGHDIRETHHPQGENLYISSMTIHPEHRGGGLGARFFRQALSHLQSTLPHLKRSTLMLSAEWQGAHRIYQNNGYLETIRLPGFFNAIAQHDAAAIVMQKELV